ncbi:hypothetical protein CEP54_008963 [Fusarium duplospermum]|uniref:Uncharacterized protein n=1 Tax=Fusarium duplospermum TaxID=1325734 RepID=A0A428PSY7_9HYPO|nr:hypothetical protein CEP54_008963 [Fusarium duplospermum]
MEAVLAPESTVYCGAETRPLSSILEAGHSLYRHHAWSHTREEFLMIRDLHLLWSYFSPETNDELPVDSRTLVALLAFLRTKLSTDPKDAMFSVLGLVKRNEHTDDSFQSLFKADYRRSLSDILASVTKYAIIETQTLDVLRFVQPRFNEDTETSQIPSWDGPNGEFVSSTKLELIDPHNVAVLKCRGEIIDDICYRFDAPEKDVVKDASTLAGFFKDMRSLFRRCVLSQVFQSAAIDDAQSTRIRSAILPNRMYSGDEESAVISSTLLMGRQYPMQEYRDDETDAFVRLESYLDELGLVLPALPDDEVILTSTFKDRSPGEQAFVRLAMVMRLALHHRVFFTTSRRLIGIGPSTMEVSDVVAMLHGFPSPAVLRPKGHGYEFLESCYVHGLMGGRDEWPAGVMTKEEIISIR